MVHLVPVAAVCVVVCVWPMVAQAQTAVPVIGTEYLAWDVTDVTTAADAQAREYVPLIDASTLTAQSAPLAGVACQAGPPVTCSVPLIPLTTGVHTIRIVARVRLDATRTADSEPSDPLGVLMTARPVKVANLRLELR